MMTTIVDAQRPVSVWRSLTPPSSKETAWWKKLLGLPSSPRVKLTRIVRVQRSTPTAVIQRKLRQGFGYCEEWMIEKMLKKPSKTPGYIVVPLAPNGVRCILYAHPNNGPVERLENPEEFDFLQHHGQWSVVMRNP